MKRLACLAALLAFAPGCLVHHWTATPDGKRLAASTEKTVLVADGDLKLLESYPADHKPAIVEISPDGKWLVYNTEEANQLWLVDRAAKTQKKIAEGEGVFLYNAWSPASNRFAFVLKTRKEGPMSGALRIYDVKTGEASTALEECAPCYAWTPSGEALFAVEPYVRADDSDMAYGRLMRWTDGNPPETLAHLAALTWVEALSEDEALCVSAVVTLPFKPEKNLLDKLPMGLFRISAKGISRAGSLDVGWISLSPDRKRLAAFVLERPQGGGDPKVRLELLDLQGASVKTLKDSAAYEKGGPLVPSWMGNDRLLVPIGEGEKQRFEMMRLDGKGSDVTEAVKAWEK